MFNPDNILKSLRMLFDDSYLENVLLDIRRLFDKAPKQWVPNGLIDIKRLFDQDSERRANNLDNIEIDIRKLFGQDHTPTVNVQDAILMDIQRLFNYDYVLFDNIRLYYAKMKSFLLLDEFLLHPIHVSVFKIMADMAMELFIGSPRRNRFEQLLKSYQDHPIIMCCFFSRVLRKYDSYDHGNCAENISRNEILKCILGVLMMKHPETYSRMFLPLKF